MARIDEDAPPVLRRILGVGPKLTKAKAERRMVRALHAAGIRGFETNAWLTHGAGDSLGYFATRRDKCVVFSPDRRAAVTYRVEGTVCVASADPIGPVDAWPAAIAAWMRECRQHSWYAAATR